MPKRIEFNKKYRPIFGQILSGSLEDLQKLIDSLIEAAKTNPRYFDGLLVEIEQKKSQKAFTTISEKLIETLQKITNKNVYHRFLLGYLYSFQNDAAEDAIHNFKLAIKLNPKFLLSYFYLGFTYLSMNNKNKTDDALIVYWQARQIDEISSFSSGVSFKIQLIFKLESLVKANPLSSYFDESIKIINDFINTTNTLAEKYKIILDFNFHKNLLSNLYNIRAQHQYNQLNNYPAAIVDLTTAVEITPTPSFYLARYGMHMKNNYLFKALQDLFKYIQAEPNLAVNSKNEIEEFKRYRRKTAMDSEPQVIILENQYLACKASKTLLAFITAYNQHVEQFNTELTKLNSKDKMEKLTLLDDLNAAKKANKSAAEINKIYNSHVDKINVQLAFFGMQPIACLTVPPTLLSLAGLVAAKSGLFKTSKITLIPEILDTVGKDPLIELMGPQP